mmetsp:Transcript_47820/g.136789  ORF Transcript_47820/g.136789 Transcript_47820/m.136789 type:complete len:311 (+) Transcript_47820:2-934(+)
MRLVRDPLLRTIVLSLIRGLDARVGLVVPGRRRQVQRRLHGDGVDDLVSEVLGCVRGLSSHPLLLHLGHPAHPGPLVLTLQDLVLLVLLVQGRRPPTFDLGVGIGYKDRAVLRAQIFEAGPDGLPIFGVLRTSCMHMIIVRVGLWQPIPNQLFAASRTRRRNVLSDHPIFRLQCVEQVIPVGASIYGPPSMEEWIWSKSTVTLDHCSNFSVVSEPWGLLFHVHTAVKLVNVVETYRFRAIFLHRVAVSRVTFERWRMATTTQALYVRLQRPRQHPHIIHQIAIEILPGVARAVVHCGTLLEWTRRLTDKA